MENQKVQLPSLGRIVLYQPKDGSELMVSIIVGLYHESEKVDLAIIMRNEDGLGLYLSDYRGIERGDEPGQWNWPPRV